MCKKSNRAGPVSAQVSMVKSKQIEPSDEQTIVDINRKNTAALKLKKAITKQAVDLENPNYILGYN
ncbi:hypothetical protein GAB14E_0788 [Colwellia psychrerythraea]|uniref:Uncharacterized protein n=1 Tax=Colwellia psychrerythraea TaxID=28229 RepID=A0A099K8A1_COLPS|nr:hypothetical protein GAB14E_0788 [Colwellia psychrerythraea]